MYLYCDKIALNTIKVGYYTCNTEKIFYEDVDKDFSMQNFTNFTGKINVRARLRVMATSKNDQINKTEDEWRESLTDEQFCVLRQHGTERPGSSPLDKQYDEGTYVCAACGQALFTSPNQV